MGIDREPDTPIIRRSLPREAVTRDFSRDRCTSLSAMDPDQTFTRR